MISLFTILWLSISCLYSINNSSKDCIEKNNQVQCVYDLEYDYQENPVKNAIPFNDNTNGYTLFDIGDILPVLYDGIPSYTGTAWISSNYSSFVNKLNPYKALCSLYTYPSSAFNSKIPDSYFVHPYGVSNTKVVSQRFFDNRKNWGQHDAPQVDIYYAICTFANTSTYYFEHNNHQYTYGGNDKVQVVRLESTSWAYSVYLMYSFDIRQPALNPSAPQLRVRFLGAFNVSDSSVVENTDFSYGVYFLDHIYSGDVFAQILRVPFISYDYCLGYGIGWQAGYDYGVAQQSGFDFTQGYNYGYEEGYREGYSEGTNAGYNSGYNHGMNDGLQEGISRGQTQGYAEGYAAAESEFGGDPIMNSIFSGIFQVGLLPVNVFLSIFNFEIFGINVSGLVSGLLTMSILIIIIRFLFGGKNND